jgi:cell division protein FtsX
MIELQTNLIIPGIDFLMLAIGFFVVVGWLAYLLDAKTNARELIQRGGEFPRKHRHDDRRKL